MHKKGRIIAVFLRLFALIVVLVAVAGIALPQKISSQIPYFAEWTGLFIALAASAGLLALASLLSWENTAPPEVASSLGRLEQQIIELDAKLNDLQMMAGRSTGSSAAAGPSRDYTEMFNKLSNAIAEVRQVSLLSDAERRQLSHSQRQQQKHTLIEQLFGMVGAHEWSKAERLLVSLETDFPNDDEVMRGRSYLDHSRKLFERDAMKQAVVEIEEMMLAAKWNEALERARTLVQGFPTSGEAQSLLVRVEREYKLHKETTAQRMFDEIRHAIDRRTWRQALAWAQQMIEQHPTHRLTEHIRGQIKTLRDNAEIEERQEMEVRIQEHLRDGRFDQAIDLAEDLMRRYPNSPQADSLETLLPKIRDLAKQGVQEFAGLSPEAASPFRSAGPIAQPTTVTRALE